ncbi:hypothetical protein GCM10011390_03460 [Aureimonas endophytica]|uniref:Uncharacterized protein n=1 Tax=Aureimonas endophytica TaxID=2027858 RepID=A0A917E0I5_9HYPH|nr:hypothetical protein [Aureimonas endophytica]GGD87994.1 hypothetical protein GCM10011390_03460 [Aureimonas endophytica]
MSDVPKPRRENVRPTAEIEALVVRVVGAALPDRLVTWLGVSKRNAERWLSGESTYPPSLVERLDQFAPICDDLIADLEDLVDEYKERGLPENLLRLRIREFSKTLSEEPPPRPAPQKSTDL